MHEKFVDELLVDNLSERVLEVRVTKREDQPQVVAGVSCDDRPAIFEGSALRFELSVATRQMLSELRDDYLSRSRFLTDAAASLKSALKKRN